MCIDRVSLCGTSACRGAKVALAPLLPAVTAAGGVPAVMARAEGGAGRVVGKAVTLTVARRSYRRLAFPEGERSSANGIKHRAALPGGQWEQGLNI